MRSDGAVDLFTAAFGPCLSQNLQKRERNDGVSEAVEAGESNDSEVYVRSCKNALFLPSLLHHRRIAAVARASRLTEEHIEIVTIVIPLLEALGAQGHAR